MTSQEQYALREIEFYFGAGCLDKLSQLRCPTCQGFLYFSVAKGERRPENGRLECGISIYCAGFCDRMLSHIDGYCPVWAENIDDWDDFSQKLYENR